MADPETEALLNQYEAYLARMTHEDLHEKSRTREKLAGMAEAWKLLYPDRPSLSLLVTSRKESDRSGGRA